MNENNTSCLTQTKCGGTVVLPSSDKKLYSTEPSALFRSGKPKKHPGGRGGIISL